MNNQFMASADKWKISGNGDFGLMSDQISDTTIDYCVRKHSKESDVFIGFGVGITNHMQTFIIHNDQVYIRAASLKEATIKHS